MIKYDKGSWPKFTIGAKRVRSYWFGQTWVAHWAEICWDVPECPERRLMGHIGWIVFWLDRKHLTLALGSQFLTTWRFTLKGGRTLSNNLTVKILEIGGLEIAAQYVGLPVGNIRSRLKALTSPEHLTRESLHRLGRLIAKGDEHAKIMRQVVVHMEITAPRYWWQQFSCYHAGVEMYSASTMHTLLRDGVKFNSFTPETKCSSVLMDAIGTRDLVRAKANLPEGFLQTRLIMASYQALRRMWAQRQTHKLPEWHSFLETLESLPYSNELIFVKQLDTT